MAYRVMILEDDPFIALDMEGVMEDAGYEIVGPVASAPEAMKLIKNDNDTLPHCALLDFYISGGTSEFVARELAKQGVPFMFLTGNADDVRNCFVDQSPIIRSKPVHANRIVDDVASLLG